RRLLFAEAVSATALLAFAAELVPVCGPQCAHRDRDGKLCDSPGKAVHRSKWQSKVFADGDFRPGENTGVRTRHHPVIDIDVDDPTIAAVVERVARQVFGAPARRPRRNSSRSALLNLLDGRPSRRA